MSKKQKTNPLGLVFYFDKLYKCAITLQLAHKY
ncbi:hypothetical protein N476_03440 [Pseudoalteromonas luteoviolacea H33]|uniref:Uncharacterized protein n=1 Tax=Pseudoalteromonas luteoviolacea H33 TaxID=1365251 RepID=A0A167B651_9GAMM|nr:hypothetical protein N476_03440 [Pseudoalteromonas luteoviolacea H33]KZN75156.1 hypothetical protein N477_19955 [Pseudoalteromonas luteoviolacea H33-S]